MFKIFIHTEQRSLGLSLAKQITTQIETVEVHLILERTWAYEITYAYDCLRSHLKTLSQIIYPLKPKRRLSETLSSQECHIHLGSSRSLDEFQVQVKTDSRDLKNKFVQSFSLYFQTQGRISNPTQSVLKFGGAPQFICDLVHWLSYQETQVEVSLEKLWNDDENDLHLFIQDPALRGNVFRENLGLIIFTDEFSDQANEYQDETQLLGSFIADQFTSKGYRPQLVKRSLETWPKKSKELGFIVNPIGFSIDLNEAQMITECVKNSLENYGIATDHYPVQIHTFEEPNIQNDYLLKVSNDQEVEQQQMLYVCIYLPYLQVLNQSIYPVSGDSRLRWTINIHYTNLGQLSEFDQTNWLQKFIDQGFSRTRLKNHSSTHKKKPQGAIYIDWGSAADFPLIQNSVRHNILNHNSFTPPIVELQSDQRRNSIEIVCYLDDFIAEKWRQTLVEACQSLSLNIIINATTVYDELQCITAIGWQNLKHQSYFEYMNSTQSEDPDGSDYEQLADDWSSSDSSQDWEQSELQEWLMSSLHDEDESRSEICIIYGGSPLFVVTWLKEELESLYETEVDVQDALSEDDRDIIIEFSPQFNSKTHHVNLFSSEIIDVIEENTLIAPPLSISKTSNDGSADYEVINKPKVERIDLSKSLKENSPQLTQVIFYPYFDFLCESLITALKAKESIMISGHPKIGISTSFFWCANKVGALCVSPRDLDENNLLPQTILSSISSALTSSTRTIFIDHYDQLPSQAQASLMQCIFGSDNVDLVGCPENTVIISLSKQEYQKSPHLKHVRLLELPEPEASDWESIMLTLLELEKFKSDHFDIHRVRDLIKYLSIMNVDVQSSIMRKGRDQETDSYLGFEGIKRLMSYLGNFMINLDSSPSKEALFELIKRVYPPELFNEIYLTIKLDELP